MRAAQTQEAYLGVLPAGTDAASLVTHDGLTTEGVIGAVTAPDGTIAVQASAAGYSGNQVTLFVSFDAAGSILNLSVDASTQTTGIGSKVAEDSFVSAFLGWNAAEPVAAGKPGGCDLPARPIPLTRYSTPSMRRSPATTPNSRGWRKDGSQQNKPSKWKIFTAGIIRENPVLRLVLGVLLGPGDHHHGVRRAWHGPFP